MTLQVPEGISTVALGNWSKARYLTKKVNCEHKKVLKTADMATMDWPPKKKKNIICNLENLIAL